MFESAHELASKRKLVGKFGHREAAQIAQDHEDVLIDCIYVKQIVLHLPYDSTEFGQIVSEDPILIHAAELVHNAARLLQDVKKKETILRAAPVFCVDPPACPPESSERRRSHSAQFLMLLHKEETFEYRLGFVLEQTFTAGFEKLAACLKTLVELARRQRCA